MATKIVTKNSSTASAVPTASDLVQGELAVNVADKRLFTEDNAGAIVELGTNPYNFTANHNGSAKLATTSTGIDVTGTATMDGLTVDGDVEIKANGGNSPLLAKIWNTGTSTNDDAVLAFLTQGNRNYSIGISRDTGSFTVSNQDGSVDSGKRLTVNNNGDISFYEDTGTTPKFFWDASAESLGIGTSSPETNLHVKGGSDMGIRIESDNDGYASLQFGDADDTVRGGITYNNADDSLQLRGYNNTERMRISSSGNLLVGKTSSGINTAGHEFLNYGRALHTVTASTVQILNRKSNDGDIALFQKDGTTVGSIGTGYGVVDIKGGTSGLLMGNSAVLPVNGSGTLTTDSYDIGAGSFRFKNLHLSGNAYVGGVYNTGIYNQQSGDIQFWVPNVGEAVRIQQNTGNLLVGKTATSQTTAGTVLYNNGQVYSTASGTQVSVLTRLSSDGPIQIFYKDSTEVGSIGTLNADPWMARANGCGVRFITAAWLPSNNTGNDSDNTVDLGMSSVRFDDIYATNGTIQTSDRNEKQDIAELSDAEQRVAVAAKGLLRKFRWKDSVAEKGDEARVHFGIIAQDLQAAFAAEGLDAGDYAMFISTTWTDEETNEEKTRMGVRYSELLAFIIAAI